MNPEVVYVSGKALQEGRVEICWEGEEDLARLTMEISERPSCLWLSLKAEGRVVARVEVLAEADPVEMEEALALALREGWV